MSIISSYFFLIILNIQIYVIKITFNIVMENFRQMKFYCTWKILKINQDK